MNRPLDRYSPLVFASLLIVPPGLNLFQYWLHNPVYGYGLWVPFLAGYLLWQRLGDASAAVAPRFPRLATALILLYLACLPALRIVQIANPDWRMVDWALSVGGVAALLAFSYRMGGKPLLLKTWLPSCFLLTAVPWATSLERLFTQSAVPATATISSDCLWTLGVAAVDVGRTLYSAVGPIEVTDDCGGIRSLILALMASLFWAGFFRMGRIRAPAMLLGGLVLAILINVFRMVFLCATAVWSGRIETVALLHDGAGIGAQLLLMAGLAALGWLLRRAPTPVPVPSAPRRGMPPPAPAPPPCLPVWPVLFVFGWLVATEAAAEGWFRIHEAAGRPGSTTRIHWVASRKPAIPGAAEMPISTVIKANYRYSDALSLGWKDSQNAPWTFYWLDFDKGAQPACIYNIHKPEACLPAADFNLMATFPDLQVAFPGGAVTFKHEYFERHGEPLHLFFTVAEDIPLIGRTSLDDWTFGGRLRVARLGLRGTRSEIIHLLVAHPYRPLDARRIAADYFQKLLRPEGK
ncbi:MAG: exosortase/archaeosortase family protein [Verrucomicrobiota bacterium]